MGVNYIETIERMRWAGKLKNDSAVARVLGVTPQALSNYKKRGEMPTDLVLRFAEIHALSVDWLISGKGEMYRFGGVPGNEDYLMAAEEAMAYGRDPSHRGCDFFGTLDADEIILVGKLLKVLRSSDQTLSGALKCTLDTFLHKIDESDGTPRQDQDAAPSSIAPGQNR
ncbi:MAG: helix-turn-helix domain-containing protein [Thermodesulfobacteriota bacterium]